MFLTSGPTTHLSSTLTSPHKGAMDENQGLWEEIKAAKTYLFTQTSFLQQYRSSSCSGFQNGTHPPSSTAPHPALAMATQNSNKNKSNDISHSARSFSPPSVTATTPSYGLSPTKSPGHSFSPATLPLIHKQDKQDKQQQKNLNSVEQKFSEEPSSDQLVSESAPSLSTVVPVALPAPSTKIGQNPPQPASLQVQNQESSLAKDTRVSVKEKSVAESQSTSPILSISSSR